MSKKTNVDLSVEYAIEQVPEQYRHHIEQKAEKLRELGNETAEIWTKVLIDSKFHNNPLTITFIAGMFENIIADILETIRDKIAEEQLETTLENNPNLKGN